MSLGTPWMLLLLPLVALAGWLMARARRLRREAACRLKGVAPESGQAGLGRGDWLALAALVCVIVALARPQWNPRPYEIERRGRDLVIALDVSRSMLAADIFPNRLEMARIAILEALPAFAGRRVALVTKKRLPTPFPTPNTRPDPGEAPNGGAVIFHVRICAGGDW